MGKYMSKEVLCSAYPGTIYDDSCIERFEFPGGYPKSLGRCFIEVINLDVVAVNCSKTWLSYYWNRCS